MLVKIGFLNLVITGQELVSNTFRSAPRSPAFSITSLSTRLHFVTSLTSAKIWVGDDFFSFDSKTRDFSDPIWPGFRKGAASKYRDICPYRCCIGFPSFG